jgi:hypothetical protein
MSKITLTFGAALAWGMLAAVPAARAPSVDLDSCHDDLDRLHRTASDASDAAEDANSKYDDLENCTQDPEVYDVWRDGCRRRRDDYQSALSDLEDKMDDVDSRLQSVQSSCEYEFTINRMSGVEAAQHRLEASKRRLCASVKKLVGLGMSPDAALQMCKANTDEQFCKACLNMK